MQCIRLFMNRKQILDYLPATESYKSRFEGILNELDSFNNRLFQVHYNEKEYLENCSWLSSYINNFSECINSQLFEENFTKHNAISHTIESYSIQSSRAYFDNAPTRFSPGYNLSTHLNILPEFNESGIKLLEWDSDKQKLREYFQGYRETGQQIFLCLIHQIIVNQREALKEGFINVRNAVRYLRNKLLSSFQRIKGYLIKNLIWFHVKRFNIDSDGEDPLIYTLASKCIFGIFILTKRINYELFRKGNDNRKVKLRYKFKVQYLV